MIPHIQIYEKAIPDDFCNHLIDLFEKNAKDIFHSPAWMDQIPMYFTPAKYPGQRLPYDWKKEVGILDTFIIPIIEDYRSRIDVLGMLPKKYSQESYRIKRYTKNEQEFRLHVDCSTHINSSRFLAVLLYLNDSEAGTEFPLHNININAQQGKIVVFPPCWPWPHRGLRPSIADKYIISTYYTYAE